MTTRSRRLICMGLVLTAFCSISCAGVKRYKIETVKEFPHDRESYTQGLFFMGDTLYESAGQYGISSFRKVDISTGKVLRRLNFDKKYFLEGSTVLDGRIYMLTWTNKVAFVYDANTLEYISTYSYPRQGWGLTTDGKSLIASDGSSRIYFMDKDFRQQRSINVKLDGKPIRDLNELEYIDGKIWANVYTTDLILIINPVSGDVEATIDCTGLLPTRLRDENTDVLNGIACHDGHIYLTGKNWPKLYEIKLVPVK